MDSKAKKIFIIVICLMLAVIGMGLQIRRFAAGKKNLAQENGENEKEIYLTFMNPEVLEKNDFLSAEDQKQMLSDMQDYLEQNGYEETELLIASTDGSKGDLVKLTIGGKDRNYIVTYKRDSRRTAVEVMER